MQKWLKILFTVLCLAFAYQASADTTSSKPMKSDRQGYVDYSHEKPQAVISENLELARICSTMPERVLPSSSFTNALRTLARTHHLFNIQKNTFTNYRGLGNIVSKPILALPSCVYFILTLRHLLC